MSSGYLGSFIGGSPATVVLRLIVVSFVVGLLMAVFGFEPENVYQAFARTIHRLVDSGFDDLRHFGRILLTGAMVVIPVWLVLRLLEARRAR